MNKFDILPSIPSKNQNFSMPKSTYIELNNSFPQPYLIDQFKMYNAAYEYKTNKARTFILPSLTENENFQSNNLKQQMKKPEAVVLPMIFANLKMSLEQESFDTKKRSNINELILSDKLSEKHENSFKKNELDLNNASPKNLLNSSPSDYQSKQLTNRDESISTVTTNSQGSKSVQIESPYFWYYREKSKFSPYKSYSSPPLVSYSNANGSLERLSLEQRSKSDKNLDELDRTKNHDQKEHLNANDANKKMEIKKRKNRVNGHEKTKEEKKDKKKEKNQNNRKKSIKNVENLPVINIKREKLTSAKLRNLAVSEKFIKEAKTMVYMPQSHSLFPFKAYEYLVKINTLNNPQKVSMKQS